MSNIEDLCAQIEASLQALGLIPPEYLPDAIKPLTRFAPRRGERVRVTLRQRKPGSPSKSRQIRSDADDGRFCHADCYAEISYEAVENQPIAPQVAEDALQGAMAESTATVARQISELIVALEAAEREPRFREFVALKNFRDQYLPSKGFVWSEQPDACHRVLASAIEQQMVLKGSVPNPRNSQHPTTSIRLNRDHPRVIEVLRKRAAERSPFRPIVIAGEPLSQTILSQRR